MDTLLQRVNFFLSVPEWVRKVKALSPQEFDAMSIPEIIALHKLPLGPNIWSAQTYLHLAKRGYDVDIVEDYVDGEVNVMHFEDLHLKRKPKRAFLVVARADRPVPVPADLVVVQNRACIEDTSRDFFLPHWPHPGLKPRDQARGGSFENLVYMGNRIYCGPEFYGDSIKASLADLGIALEIRDDPKQWADFSDVDAVLAVRAASDYDKSIKPPLKLFNAWRAGCIPFIGVESATRQVGTHGKDYVELTEPDDLLSWCERLKASPEEAQRMREAGARSAARFTDDRIAAQWVELINGPIAKKYRKWRARPEPLRRAWSVVSLPLSYLVKKRERRRFEIGIGLQKS